MYQCMAFIKTVDIKFLLLFFVKWLLLFSDFGFEMRFDVMSLRRVLGVKR